MILDFKVEQTSLVCTSHTYVVSDSVHYVGAHFTFDDTWKYYVKTATFQNHASKITKAVLLDDTDGCLIPWEVLRDAGKLSVSVTGVLNDVKVITACMASPIPVKQAGEDGGMGCPTPDLFDQFMNELSKIQTGMVDPAKIQESVAAYLAQHPLNALAKDNTEEYTPTEDYHPATKKYVDENKAQGPKGEPGTPGEDGADGITPHIGDNGNWFIGDTDTGTAAVAVDPAGRVICVLSTKAPEGYLQCDGAVLNIADYQALADYIKAEFGTVNKYGGDGTATFAVPTIAAPAGTDLIYCVKW